ncbi:ferredoxin [Umezawaea sp. Da 62-37]|uniref:ferredoxin n=1 Tax=Umezawaea sp. Da 62-37 TaxID=3075927 RepID=UPI0028F732FA|nr:ferredoxin [Umezawaea sp. Da 62-37]WNV92015.1 ferredoxin [Umezawaea sp. Da 62-37]
MELLVDAGRCCGAGQCALAAADIFDQDDEDGTVVLLEPYPSAERLHAVRQAVQTCPTGAIRMNTHLCD